MVLGQFNIFGAIEEFSPADSLRTMQIRNNISKHSRMRVIVRVLAFVKNDDRSLLEWAAGLFTGLAQEMQNGKG